MGRFRRWLVPLVLSAVVAVTLAVTVNRLSHCRALGCISFPGSNEWKTVDVFEDTDTAWRGMLTRGEELLRAEFISGVSASEAAEFTKIRLMKLEGLYDPARSPYPGAISHTVRCDDTYRPHPTVLAMADGTPVTYFRGYLNDRLMYGTCSANQISFVAFTGKFYCGRTKVWADMEIIVPAGSARPEDVYIGFFKPISCGTDGGL